jgi:hypothetical protein
MQIFNYALVAGAILATAYVSAITAKLYFFAVAVGFAAFFGVLAAFFVAFRQRRIATIGEIALERVRRNI